MFHNSTTLHHSHRQFTGFTSREARMPQAGMGKLAEIGLKMGAAGSYLSPIGRLFKIYSWFLGWPLIVKGAQLTAKGIGKALYGIEWSAHATKEVAKGGAQMTVKPVWLLAYSRLVAIKRMMVDVPIATLSAAIRTPIAIATSPLQAIKGVREAIGNVPKNAGELYSGIKDLNLGNLVSGTRGAIGDVFKPITKPAGAILSPLYNIANKAVGAELQTITKFRQGIQSIFEGKDTVVSSGSVASAEMAQIYDFRLARKAARDKEKQEKKEAREAQIAEYKGEGTKKAAA